MRRFFILFLLLLWYDAQTMANESPDAFQFIREIDGIREYELKANGMRVLLLENHSAPVTTVMVTYLVGSRHETEQFRGGAHLLEHMMFKGTPSFNKSKGNSIASVLQNTGAVLNASTWRDGTNYFETLPNDKLDLALEIESDRMRNSLMRGEDLRLEMPVVQSEFDRMENSPFAALDMEVWGQAFKKHPYQYPIIGIRADLEKMPIESLKKFYDTYYWPENAVLALIGDFKTDEALKKIELYFSKIPRPGKKPAQEIAAEPPQEETRTVTLDREDQVEAVSITHKIPAAAHPDSVALDVLSFILSRGKTCRFYRALVDQGLAVEVHTDSSRSHDPGIYNTEIMLTSQAHHDDIAEIVLGIYADIRENGVGAQEFARAKNQLWAEIAYSRDGSYSMGEHLSRAIAAGDWALFSEYLNKLREVGPGDVQKVAKTYLNEKTLTAGYLYSKNPAVALEKRTRLSKEEIKNLSTAKLDESATAKLQSAAAPEKTGESSPAAAGKLSQRIRRTVADGIKILSMHSDVKDVVTLMGSFEGAGQAYSENPLIPSVTASMLDEGSVNRDKFEIAKLLEDRGAKISFQIDHQRVGFHARCLKADVDLVIALIAEQLRQPRFDETEFGKQLEQHRVHIQYALSDTAARAQSELARAIYPPAHPHYEIPFEEQLRKLSEVHLEEVEKFHRTHYGKQDMIVVATGDVDAETFEKSVRKHFKDWGTNKDLEAGPKNLPKLPPKQSRTIRIPDKVKVDVFFGHGLNLTRGSEDYLAVYAANAILGGDFSARLSSIVRDEMGLTYHTYSDLHGIDHDTHGHWEINIILNNQFLKKGIEATVSEIERFIRDGVTGQELKNKKETIKGKFKVSLSTTGGLARQILRNEELAFTLEYLDEYPQKIDALTLENVNKKIREYFKPENLHRVIAGTVNESIPQDSSV